MVSSYLRSVCFRLIMDPKEMTKFEDDYLDRRSQFRRTGVGHIYLTKEQLKQMSRDIQNEKVDQK